MHLNLWRLVHWGPIFALSLIKLVIAVTVHCTYMWWPLGHSVGGTMNMMVFFSFAILTIYNLLSAICVGPGFLPLQWHPVKYSDENNLQRCVICDGFKAPRSHHCRKCGRCVLKMDHHCPWINTCVGHKNHLNFTSFLFFAVCGSIQSTTLLIATALKFVRQKWQFYEESRSPPITFSLFSLVTCLFCIGISIGVAVSLGMLFYFQIKSILRNKTGIEDWIIEKAQDRREIDPTLAPFTYPYDLGWLGNFKQVVSFKSLGDGITWDVKEGCSEYDLTIEQREQKILKSLRKKPYKVIYKYGGMWLPVIHGFKTFCHPPCTLENRMALDIDEVVIVTRIHDYWLFGEKRIPNVKLKCKGWFPKACVIPLTEINLTIKKKL